MIAITFPTMAPAASWRPVGIRARQPKRIPGCGGAKLGFGPTPN